jgi:hypothetical protein
MSLDSCLWVWILGFRFQDLRFRAYDLGLRV